MTDRGRHGAEGDQHKDQLDDSSSTQDETRYSINNLCLASTLSLLVSENIIHSLSNLTNLIRHRVAMLVSV